MANGRHQLARRGRLTDERKHLRFATQPVGHESAGQDHALEIGRTHVGNRRLGPAGITMLAAVNVARAGPGDDNLGPGLDQPQLGVPKLQVLVDVLDKGQDAPRT